MKSVRSSEVLLFICTVVLFVLVLRYDSLLMKERAEAQVTATATGKELDELREAVANAKLDEKACLSVAAGDGTKTILVDTNHPYGKFVPSAATLPPGYIPGAVWIINGRVTPRTMDGTLNGAYAYEHQDGSLDGWYLTGGSKR